MVLEQIGWESPDVTSELVALVDQMRSAEQSVQEALQRMDAGRRDSFIRAMIIGDAGEACDLPLEQFQDAEELCRACLEARGPFDGGRQRQVLRERARIHLRFSGDAHAIRSVEDLLALWDEATCREPKTRLFLDEPRWRVDADGLPFTRARLAPLVDPVPLAPGLETADPEDIPQLAEAIVDFVHCDDLPPEVVAFSLFYLVFRVHPFVDGNGHTMRMLVCDILHRAGYSEPTLLAYVNVHRERLLAMCDLSIDVSLGRARPQDHIAFLMKGMLQAQEQVLGLYTARFAPCSR